SHVWNDVSFGLGHGTGPWPTSHPLTRPTIPASTLSLTPCGRRSGNNGTTPTNARWPESSRRKAIGPEIGIGVDRYVDTRAVRSRPSTCPTVHGRPFDRRDATHVVVSVGGPTVASTTTNRPARSGRQLAISCPSWAVDMGPFAGSQNGAAACVAAPALGVPAGVVGARPARSRLEPPIATTT